MPGTLLNCRHFLNMAHRRKEASAVSLMMVLYLAVLALQNSQQWSGSLSGHRVEQPCSPLRLSALSCPGARAPMRLQLARRAKDTISETTLVREEETVGGLVAEHRTGSSGSNVDISLHEETVSSTATLTPTASDALHFYAAKVFEDRRRPLPSIRGR